MKIGILAPLVTPIREPQLGGSQALVCDIARGLTARGHDVTVYAASGSAIPDVHVVDTGVDAHALQETLFRADRPAAPSEHARDAFAAAWAGVAEGAHDLVHNHAFDAPAVELASATVPVVHTLHLPPQDAIIEALRNAARGPNPPWVAVVSRAQERLWSARTGVHAVLRNGVPTARIPWSSEPGPAALYAGRISPEKGVVDAIQIAMGAGVAIDVLGDPYDPDYAAEHVAPLASEHVRLSPGVRRETLWSRMAEACAVLCPIHWEEPFGLVAAEAQAAGTPIIGYRRGALPEVVADGMTGRLVDEGDIDAAAEALRHRDRFDRRVCREHAEHTLDLEATIDAHEALYERVLAGHEPSHSGTVEGS